MAKAKGSLIPMRGSVEDWGPGKQQRNLEAKEAYARKMREQAAKGPPDFDALLTLGAAPTEERGRTRSRASRKKATKKTAKRRAKKTTTRQKKKKSAKARR